MNFSEQFCAFIDILGFKNKMQNFEEALEYYKHFFTSYKAFDKMHDNILQNVSDALQNKVPLSGSSMKSVESMIFSDSIILYSSDWTSLLFRITNVMSHLLSSGFLFRGGIGYGKHYSDIQLGQTYIVSEGLVQAVEIEGKISNYPRIVISQSALEQILNQMNSLYDLNNMLIQSEDNRWFLNPFFLNPDITLVHQRIVQDIDTYHTEKFVEKYFWMHELCNYFHEQNYVRKFPSKYYLNDTIQQHFFYPKTFHYQVYGDFNYSLSQIIYKQSFQTNIKQVMQQVTNKD